MEKDCIFCKIVKNEIPSIKLYEDKEILAFMDIKPINQGHLLIIPKPHSELVIDVNDTILAKMFMLAKKLNKALRNSGLKCNGVDYFLADGPEAGQEVFHTHLHLIPRFKGDGFGFKFPDNYNEAKPNKEILSSAKLIKSKLKF